MSKINLNLFKLDCIEYFNTVHGTLTFKSIKRFKGSRKFWLVIPQEIKRQFRGYLYNNDNNPF